MRSARIVTAGLAGLAFLGVAPSTTAPQRVSAGSANPRATAEAPAEIGLSPSVPGYVSVVDSVGTIRGYITEAELSGEPGKLPLGTGAVPVNGFEVRDLDGTLTGYMLSGNGFIDPTSAKDPKVVDSLLLNPLQVIDSEGKLVGAVEWLARTRAGTARTR